MKRGICRKGRALHRMRGRIYIYLIKMFSELFTYSSVYDIGPLTHNTAWEILEKRAEVPEDIEPEQAHCYEHGYSSAYFYELVVHLIELLLREPEQCPENAS